MASFSLFRMLSVSDRYATEARDKKSCMQSERSKTLQSQLRRYSLSYLHSSERWMSIFSCGSQRTSIWKLHFVYCTFASCRILCGLSISRTKDRKKSEVQNIIQNKKPGQLTSSKKNHCIDLKKLRKFITASIL
jgi:hypothetical protein